MKLRGLQLLLVLSLLPVMPAFAGDQVNINTDGNVHYDQTTNTFTITPGQGLDQISFIGEQNFGDANLVINTGGNIPLPEPTNAWQNPGPTITVHAVQPTIQYGTLDISQAGTIQLQPAVITAAAPAVNAVSQEVTKEQAVAAQAAVSAEIAQTQQASASITGGAQMTTIVNIQGVQEASQMIVQGSDVIVLK